MVRKRPCSICRHWFQPDARVGKRQRVCSSPACQAARRKKTQASWREKNPDYFAARRLAERAARAKQAQQAEPAEQPSTAPAKEPSRGPPVRMPPPLDRLPWDVAQDEFGVQGADFLELFGRVLVRVAQDQRRAQPLDSS